MDINHIPLSTVVWIAIGIAVAWIGISPVLSRRYKHVRGPAALPFLGNLLDVQKETWHGFHIQCLKTYGNVFKTWHGATPHVVVAGADAVKQVLNRCSFRFMYPSPIGGIYRQLYLEGLLFAKDMEYHRALKSVWAPAFHSNSLAQLYTTMLYCADKVTAVLELAVERKGGHVDIWRMLSCMTMEVVGSSAFGINLDTLSSMARDLGGDISQVAATHPCAPPGAAAAAALATQATDASGGTSGASLGSRVVWAIEAILDSSRPEDPSAYVPLYLMFPWMGRLIAWIAQVFPDRQWAKLLRAQREMRDVAAALIASERAALAEQAAAEAAPAAAPGGAAAPAAAPRVPGLLPGSFLKHMLTVSQSKGGQPLTDLQLQANVITFLAAGFETTANSLGYTVYYLALHPEAQERVIREVDAFGRDAAPTVEDLATRFPFIDACWHEAMRLLPPAPYLFRLATEDMTLAAGSSVGACGGSSASASSTVQVPKGTQFQVSIAALHRHPDVWPDADGFHPERFLPGSPLAPRDPGAFVPFGGGQRLCVGFKFATQEAKLTLVRLFQRFRFELSAACEVPLRTATGITMAPCNGVPVRVIRRQ